MPACYLEMIWVQAMRKFEKLEAKAQDGNYLLCWEFIGYVMGVFDSTEAKYSLQDNITKRQVFFVVVKYLNAHPEEWNQKASELVQRAFRQALPAE